MEKTEITVGRWKVKRVDSMNWQVFELREIKHEGRGKGAGANRKGEVDWMACPAFFAHLEYALEWIYERETADMGARRDLKDAVKQMRAIKTELVGAVRAAMA